MTRKKRDKKSVELGVTGTSIQKIAVENRTTTGQLS